MPFNLEFKTTHIPQCMLFHPSKVPLKVFSTLSERTAPARQPAEGQLARRWPKATGVGAAVFSKMLDVKVMYAPPKLDPPCLTFFRRLLNIVHVKM